MVCQVLPRRCRDGTRVLLVRAPVRGGEGLSAPFGGWSHGPARDASARTEDAEPGPGRVDAGPTRPRPLPQGGRAKAAPFAPSHRPCQLLGGAPPVVADPAGSCVSACGELPCSAFRGSAIFPSMSPAQPAAPRRARGRVFQRSAAPRACVDLGARLRRRRDGVRRRVGGCEVPFLWTSKIGQKLHFLASCQATQTADAHVLGRARKCSFANHFWKPQATAG